MFILTAVTARNELRRNRPDRRAWTYIYAGFAFWAFASILLGIAYIGFDERPVPAFVDLPFLLFYPAVFVGMELLIRTRLRAYTKIPWIDGLTGILAMAAIAAAFILEPIDNNSDNGLLTTITLLAYPIGDLILIWLVATMFTICGWQRRGPWLPLGFSLILFAVADTVFAVAGPADDYVTQLLNPLWLFGFIFLNVATWRNTDEEPTLSPEPWRLFLPVVSSVIAVGIILSDQFMELPKSSVLLAVAVLLTIGGRMIATIRESRRLEVTQIQAVTDDLTGLGNRRAITAMLDQISEGAKTGQVHAGALVIDINRFKALNDALGHAAGDVVIASIAAAIRRAVKGRGLCARIAGDEFTVLISDGADASFLEDLAADIKLSLDAPLRLEGLDVHVDASVGGALLPEHAASGPDLMIAADAAMRQAKGRNLSYELYHDRGDRDPRERLRRLEELRSAADNNELIVHYQPKIRLSDMEPSGVEALLRWNHPTFGLLHPSDFLDLADQAGQMRPIAREVLRQSIAGQNLWRKNGLKLNVAVNLSASNLLDLSLPAMIAGEFETAGADPSTFTFEVNENVVMSQAGYSLEVLEQIRLLGSTISLDDFGAGTTSLAHLRDLPIDEVKLDRTFIQSILGNEKDRNIVEALVNLAKRLDLAVVAEGVELPDTAVYLAGIGCDYVQGNMSTHALPADEIVTWASGR